MKHMITTKVDYQNSSKNIGTSALLSMTLPHKIDRLSIILSLKLLLSAIKIENSSKDGEEV